MEKNQELEFAKIEDKIKFCSTKNIITHTDFYTEVERTKINKYLSTKSIKNFFWDGVTPSANRQMLFFYPDKINEELARQNVNNILKIIRINLPKENYNKYEHRDYLSAIMKFGIIREKIGDIIVYNEGADYIVQTENANYLKDNLNELTRFSKSEITILDISKIHENASKTELINIIINSMRIDNFVSEIAHTSRSKADEIIISERVQLNYEITTKNSKEVKLNDLIIINGFGRYVVKEIIRKTKSDKLVIELEHNI